MVWIFEGACSLKLPTPSPGFKETAWSLQRLLLKGPLRCVLYALHPGWTVDRGPTDLHTKPYPGRAAMDTLVPPRRAGRIAGAPWNAKVCTLSVWSLGHHVCEQQTSLRRTREKRCGRRPFLCPLQMADVFFASVLLYPDLCPEGSADFDWVGACGAPSNRQPVPVDGRGWFPPNRKHGGCLNLKKRRETNHLQPQNPGKPQIAVFPTCSQLRAIVTARSKGNLHHGAGARFCPAQSSVDLLGEPETWAT